MFRLMRWSVVPAMALVLICSLPAAAQVQATAVLKSGERHTGTSPWTRIDKGEFSLRKGTSDSMRVPANAVWYVDFGGTADVNPQISGSQQAVVMRNGNVLRGQLIEMGHTNSEDQSTQFLVVFKDDQGQEHRLRVQDVARVYFSPGSQTTTTTGTTSGTTGVTSPSGGIVVTARQPWTPTGITVRRGEMLTFSTTGEVQLSGDGTDVATPAGAKSGRNAPNAPVATAPAGALIARIGNGRPFAIGNQTTLTMSASGQLFLGVNDDGFEDNNGEFRVEISRRVR